MREDNEDCWIIREGRGEGEEEVEQLVEGEDKVKRVDESRESWS